MHSNKQLSTMLTEVVKVALPLCAAASVCISGCARVRDAAVKQTFCQSRTARTSGLFHDRGTGASQEVAGTPQTSNYQSLHSDLRVSVQTSINCYCE
jgi:hypothetical protein